MKKVRFRNVKELYETTSEVFESKKVGYPIKKPSDGKNRIVGLNMGSSVTENIFGSNQYLCDKLQMRKESQTYDMCTSSCSCGMISGRPAPLMRMKADNGFLDEKSKGEVDIQRLCGSADMPSPMDNTCDSRNVSTSEISNLLSACSSHDSFSEYEESKETLRPPGVPTHSEILAEVNTQTCGFSGLLFCGNNIVLKENQKQRELESFGDDASCISGSEHTNKISGNHIGYADQKNVLSHSASIASFPAIGNAANIQPASLFDVDHFNTVDGNQPKNLMKFIKDSPLATAVLSSKSNLSDISSARDCYIRATSSKGEPSECSEEQVESSLMRAATFMVDGQMQDTENLAESVKSEDGMKDGEPAAEAAKYSDHKECFMRLAGVDKPTKWQPTLQSHPVNHEDVSDRMEDKLCAIPAKWQPTLQSHPVNHEDVSDLMEDEVKVCDICGDVGQEEKLATCSKCSDGAEHIYCMHQKLEKVPEGNWMCEECMLRDENEKQKQERLEKEKPKLLKKSSLSEISMESNSEGLGGDKSKKNENSTHHLHGKRPVDDSEAFTVLKRRALEKSHNSSMPSKEPKPCSKAVMYQDSSVKSMNKLKMNSTYEGSPSKSKSFSSVNLKVEFKQSDDVIKNQNLGRETSSFGSKEGVAGMSGKFISSKHAFSDHVNNEVKNIFSNFAHVEMKGSRRGKEQNMVLPDITLHNPSMRLPVADNCAAASMGEKKIPHCSEASVLSLYKAKHHDLMTVQGDGQISNSSTTTSNVTHRYFPSKEQSRLVNDAKHSVDDLKDAAFATKSNNLVSIHPFNGLPYPKGLPWISSAVDVPCISIVPQLECIWQGGFGIQRSGSYVSSCDGIQAHLSSYASPKVCEVVHKLPQKIPVEQVSCLVMWPTQLPKIRAKEDNIALYFFAKDFESYESNYKILLECMIKNDFGLKANIDGLDLLIFSSNLLPEKSQRWNGLLFLWGLFRGRKIDCSEDIPTPHRTFFSDLSVAPSGSQNLHSSDHLHGNLSSSNISFNNQISHPVISVELSAVPRARMDETCENKVSSPQQQLSRLRNSDAWLSTHDTPMKIEQFSRNVQHNDSSQGLKKEIKNGEEVVNAVRDIVGSRVDEHLEGERKKNFDGVFERSSSGDALYVSDRLPSGVIGLDPGFVKSTSGQWQVVSMNAQPPVDSGSLNLELSLGTEKGVAKQEVRTSVMGDHKSRGNKDFNAVASDINDECLTSLTLSLALPSSMEKQEVKQAVESKLSFDTSLSLSL